MLSFEQAKTIGVDACIDRLGRDFYMQYRDTSSSGYGDMDDRAYCFVGINDADNRYDERPLTLTSNNSFPYRASCTVRYEDGGIDFIEYTTPEHTEVNLPEYMNDLV